MGEGSWPEARAGVVGDLVERAAGGGAVSARAVRAGGGGERAEPLSVSAMWAALAGGRGQVKAGGRWRCPGCGAMQDEPPDWDEGWPRARGEHRKIFRCAWCPAGLCVDCYVAHVDCEHPELRGKPARRKERGRRRRRL